MKLFLFFLFCLFLSGFAVIAQSKSNVSVKAEVQDFATETSVAVACDQFDYTFKTSKKNIVFNNKATVDQLHKFIAKFKQVKNQQAIDVRGKVTFINNGKATTYCFDKFAVFYKDGRYFENIPLLHFIGKKIFNDDLQYLDK